MAFWGRKEPKPGKERLRSKTSRPISSSPAPNGKMFPPDRCFRRDATKRSAKCSRRSFIKATRPTSLSRQIRPLSERNIGPKSNGGIALWRRRLSFFAAADRRSFLKIAFLMILVFALKDFFDASDPGANDGHRKQFQKRIAGPGPNAIASCFLRSRVGSRYLIYLKNFPDFSQPILDLGLGQKSYKIFYLSALLSLKQN